MKDCMVFAFVYEYEEELDACASSASRPSTARMECWDNYRKDQNLSASRIRTFLQVPGNVQWTLICKRPVLSEYGR